MIELARKYEAQIKEKIMELSLEPRYMYYFGEAGSYEFSMGDNTVWAGILPAWIRTGNCWAT